MVDASNDLSCVLAPREGCQEAYRGQDQQRRERNQGVLRLESVAGGGQAFQAWALGFVGPPLDPRAGRPTPSPWVALPVPS